MTQNFNQQSVLKQHKKTNLLLAAIFVILSIWVMSLLYQQYSSNKHTKQVIQDITDIHIHRNSEQTDIVLRKIMSTTNKTNDPKAVVWQIDTPFKGKASTSVIQAFLKKLNNQCLVVPAHELPRKPQTIATVSTNKGMYEIGEVNTVSDRVYVSHQNNVALCDKLVAAIALAPAIHYIDKNLYEGELTALVGQYGTLSKTQDVDMSVLDIKSLSVVDYNTEHAGSFGKNNPRKLTLTSKKGSKNYQVTISEDKQFLLLYSEEKQLIYAIAYQQPIATILGL